MLVLYLTSLPQTMSHALLQSVLFIPVMFLLPWWRWQKQQQLGIIWECCIRPEQPLVIHSFILVPPPPVYSELDDNHTVDSDTG